MGIGRLGRIGKNLTHNDVFSHGGRIDARTYTAASLYGSDEVQRVMDTNTLSQKTVYPKGYVNMYFQWANLDTAKISSNTYMSNMTNPTVNSNSDYTGPVDVDEQYFNMSGNPGPGDYYIYIAHKVTTSTTYYNDTPIYGVQVLDQAGNVLYTIDVGAVGEGNVRWQNLTGTNSGQQSSLLNPYIYGSVSYSWADVSPATGTGKFALATSTSSSATGSQGGVNIVEYASNSTPFPVGFRTMNQQNSLQYLYRETSGATLNTFTVMRSKVQYTIPQYGSIRIIHANTTYSGQSVDTDQTLFVGIAP
jgi:hypothetical protein